MGQKLQQALAQVGALSGYVRGHDECRAVRSQHPIGSVVVLPSGLTTSTFVWPLRSYFMSVFLSPCTKKLSLLT